MSELDACDMQIFEALLTAEIFNRNPRLDENDLSPVHRNLFGINGSSAEAKRPVVVSDGSIERVMGIPRAHERLKGNPFVRFEEFGQRLSISAMEPAARWFVQSGGGSGATSNPALASLLEGLGAALVSYTEVREKNPPVEDSRSYLDAKMASALKDDEPMKAALDLLIVSAPDEIEQTLGDLVCTPHQMEVISKIKIAVRHREFLRDHRIYELGKFLFVGPPGTGKTSLALALTRELHMPVLEVRLSMITSQYLGETSKNIDRVFQFAKKMAPCILFIDEFDFVAKSRITDDHGAMKRAVNMLLKNIDRISLIRDRVLLVAATNHPQLLDEAAWRRFDDVVEFPLPDEQVRGEILLKLLSPFDCVCDSGDLAARTEGFSGSDLRIMVKEALLAALSRNRSCITREDLEQGIALITNRNALRSG
ncbi:MAG: ATP-binding protein [Methanomicrobiales archaeon]|nr:ATP-binding protein [Methanomicrobiales archaeon]